MQHSRTRTNFIVRALLLMYAVFTLFCMPLSLNTYATDSIPNNAPVYNGGEAGDVDPDKPDKPNANDVFSGAEVGVDSTGYADGIGELLSKVVNFLVNLINYLFAFALIVHFAVDALMMAFPMFATLFATKVPIQLFSNECAQVCGVKYSYKPGGNGSGGVGSAGAVDSGGGVGSAGGNNKDKGFLGKAIPYAKERLVTLIICGLLLVMAGTGVLPWIINTAINWLLGLIFN